MADSLHEWSSPQHKWNSLHTPHLHSWGLTTKKGMNVVAMEVTPSESLDKKATLIIQGKGPRHGLI